MFVPDLLRSYDVEIIAQRLLGAVITTNIDQTLTSGIIVETEAYKAPEDKGSHAYGGLRTQRTKTLYAAPGTAYVYLCYGIHHLFNIVTGPKDVAHAVLIRAIEPILGIDTMMKRRKRNVQNKNLTNGPGKLTQALGIDTSHDGYDLFSKKKVINIQLESVPLQADQIIAGPRVGIGYAQECANWPWRYRIRQNPWTSQPHNISYSDT